MVLRLRVDIIYKMPMGTLQNFVYTPRPSTLTYNSLNRTTID